jgi:hypothetical protein
MEIDLRAGGEGVFVPAGDLGGGDVAGEGAVAVFGHGGGKIENLR